MLGPADRTIHIREEGPPVQLRGYSEVEGKWINGQYALGTNNTGKNWPDSKDVKLMVEEKIAHLISRIDDCVNDIFIEHNQEAEHLVKLGAEGQRHNVIDRGSKTERWKAVRGFWDDSSKING